MKESSPFYKSKITKHSVVINGHKTSVSLEDQFWKSADDIAYYRGMTRNDLIEEIDLDRRHYNLSSAIRCYCLAWYRFEVKKKEHTLRTAPTSNTAHPEL